MSRLTILFVFAVAYEVLGDGVGKDRDSRPAETGHFAPMISAAPGYSLGLGAYSGHAVEVAAPAIVETGVALEGRGTALNNAGGAGAAHLSAIQNAQAGHVAEVANAAAAAIHGARVTEAAARAGQASAIKNAHDLDEARVAHIQRAQAAAWENARAAEAARRAAALSQAEAIRARQSEQMANNARAQAIAIANSRAIEAAKIANAAKEQAEIVVRTAARAQAVADAVARDVSDLNEGVLVGGGPMHAVPVVAGPATVGLGGLGYRAGYSYGAVHGHGHGHGHGIGYGAGLGVGKMIH